MEWRDQAECDGGGPGLCYGTQALRYHSRFGSVMLTFWDNRLIVGCVLMDNSSDLVILNGSGVYFVS